MNECVHGSLLIITEVKHIQVYKHVPLIAEKVEIVYKCVILTTLRLHRCRYSFGQVLALTRL